MIRKIGFGLLCALQARVHTDILNGCLLGWQVSVEQPDNVDAGFIGEFALKHTSELLGL